MREPEVTGILEGDGQRNIEDHEMDTTHDNSTAKLEGHLMESAIVAVVHVASGKRLICSAKCLSKRLSDQRRCLDSREHKNPDLAADLLREGPEGFTLTVLEFVPDPTLLRQRRRVHLQQARAAGKCYNLPDSASLLRTTVATEARDNHLAII